MEAQTFVLSAAARPFAVSASSPAASEPWHYVQRAYAKAKVLLRIAGLDASPNPACVHAQTDRDGRLASLAVLRSSGSPDIDQALEGVLRRIVGGDGRSRLRNGTVTLSIGGDAAGYLPAAASALIRSGTAVL